MTRGWIIHGVVAADAAPPADAPAHQRVACGSLAALVSPATLGADAALDAAEALRHDAILRAWAAVADVAPARFGAVVADPARAAALVAAEAARHAAVLRRVRGAVEMGVRVTAEGPAPVPSPPPGLGYLRAQAHARDAARAAVAARAALVRALVATLGAHAREQIAFAPRAAADGPERLAEVALLVDRAALPILREVAALATPQAVAGGLGLRLSGPWAPYSFAGPAEEAAA